MNGHRLLRLAVLAALIWRIGLLPGEINNCGPVGPHAHELLGEAGARDLAEHLAAEAACQEGQRVAPQAAAHGARGLVLSISAMDSQGAIAMGLGLIALLPILAALGLPGGLWSWLPSLAWARPSLELSPPSPPPCLISCVRLPI
jgi:hypothetical protein